MKQRIVQHAPVAVFIALVLSMNRPFDGWAKDEPPRYRVICEDGRVVSGREIDHPQKAWTHGGGLKLDGRSLSGKHEAPRLIQDLSREARLIGPHVEFTNGDRLPGRIQGILDADVGRGLPRRLSVLLTPPLQAVENEGPMVTVHPSRIVRAVLQVEPGAASTLPPGHLMLADKRVVPYRAMRWRRNDLQVLTSEGIRAFPLEDVVAWHAEASGRAAAVLEDHERAPERSKDQPLDVVLRIQVQNGALMSSPAWRVVSPGSREILLVQPSWAVTPMRVNADTVVRFWIRPLNRVPLSLLPATLVERRDYTGFRWPWYRDRNVHGQELRSDPVVATTGIGMHAYCTVSFELPDGARSFSSRVAIDSSSGRGGCAKAAVFADRVGEERLWESGFLRGGQPPVQTPAVAVVGKKRLVLVADFGHEGRPRGADPFDIRDAVNWLDPMVEVEGSGTVQPIEQRLPQLREWNRGQRLREDFSTVPVWHRRIQRWTYALRPNRNEAIRLSRTVTLTPANAWLSISAGRNRYDRGHHELSVWVDGKRTGTFLNGDVQTNVSPDDFCERVWGLGAFVGREVCLEVEIKPKSVPGGKPPAGVTFEHLGLTPLVEGLPREGEIIRPDISLGKLTPLHVNLVNEDDQLRPGKLANGKPLVLRSLPCTAGYGVRAGAEIRYALRPEWHRFVAVVGLTTEGWQGIGPFSLTVDGKSIWQSAEPAQFDRVTEPRQIDVAIPPGGKTITLKIARGESYGAWAYAGFVLDTASNPVDGRNKR